MLTDTMSRIQMRKKRNFLIILVMFAVSIFIYNLYLRQKKLPNNTSKIYKKIKEEDKDLLKQYETSQKRFTKRSYKLSCVADQDLLSSFNNRFRSYRIDGTLNVTFCADCSQTFMIDVSFNEKPTNIFTDYCYKNRGAELSELINFNGKLYTCDDRTGIVFELTSDNNLIPFVLLPDGDGTNSSKGFKCEWMIVKSGELIVGSIGKEWTSRDGVILNYNPTYVKVISRSGIVSHLQWKENYNKVRRSLGYALPGYFVIETILYSATRQSWIFLPRRVSKHLYNEKTEKKCGSNLLVETDMNFNILKILHVGHNTSQRGFSSAKFIPDTNETLIFALRTEEVTDDIMKTYYTVFTITGDVLIKEQLLSDTIKYEGVEFII